MTNLYICGASDCFKDPEFYGKSWMERMEQQLSAEYKIHNHSVYAASNFLIREQIERAITNNADAIIVHFTSSIRHEIRINDRNDSRDLLDRFYRFEDNPTATLLSLSVFKTYYNVLDRYKKDLLRNFEIEFFDLDVAIKKNYYLIQNSLDTLVKSGIPFIFSQGGFEHPSYMDSPSDYIHAFDEWNQWRSEYNLWNHFEVFDDQRPWFHIASDHINTEIGTYFANWVKNL